MTTIRQPIGAASEPIKYQQGTSTNTDPGGQTGIAKKATAKPKADAPKAQITWPVVARCGTFGRKCTELETLQDRGDVLRDKERRRPQQGEPSQVFWPTHL